MELILLILGPEGNPSWIRLDQGETRVGRGADNDLVLPSSGVSRHHAALVLDGEIVTVRDLDSTYGTRVGGVAVKSKQVGLGEAIDIGSFRLIPLPASAGRPESATTAAAVFGPVTPMPLNVADTGEFHPDLPTEPKVMVSGVRPADGSAWTEEQTDVVEGVYPLGEPAKEPWRVQMVDGWGAEALSTVINSTADLGVQDRREESRGHEFSGAALKALQKLAMLVASAPGEEHVLRSSLDIMSDAVELDTAVILELVGENLFKARAVVHNGPLKNGEVPVSRTVVHRAVREHAPVISDNLLADREYGRKQSVHLYRVGALIAVPAIVQARVVGVLYLARKPGQSFSGPEIGFVQSTASMIAMLLYHERLLKEVE